MLHISASLIFGLTEHLIGQLCLNTHGYAVDAPQHPTYAEVLEAEAMTCLMSTLSEWDMVTAPQEH